MADKKTPASASDSFVPTTSEASNASQPTPANPTEEKAKSTEVNLTDEVAADKGDTLAEAMKLKESQATKEQKIKDILKNNGMDSQQQINAFNQLKEVLEDVWESFNAPHTKPVKTSMFENATNINRK